MSRVLLGGWGHSHLDPGIYAYDYWWETGLRAGTRYWRSKRDVEQIFPEGNYPYNIFDKFSIPPHSRAFEGGFDYYPFLLYDEVVMDVSSYNYILNAPLSSSHFPCWFSPNTVQILEELRANNIIILEDYSSQLRQPEVSKLLSQLLQEDMMDTGILLACIDSMSLWQNYLLESSGINGFRSAHIRTNIIPRLEKAQQAIKGGYTHAIPDIGTYLYECLGDINSTLFLAQMYDIPIYDWESYNPFYAYKLFKLSNSGKVFSLDYSSQKFQQLIEVFVPNFRLNSASEILDIRSNKKFAAVRNLLSKKDLDSDIDELLHEATDGILKMKEAQESFSKVMKWITLPLDFLPFPAAGTLVQEIAEKIYANRMGKKYEWQLFFLDARKKYSRETVNSLIVKNKNI